MSKISTRKITCKNCGEKFDADIYDSVNVDLDPDLREKFIFDELYAYKCPHCKEMMFYAYPILYHDMKHKFMVQSGNLAHVYREFYNIFNKKSDDELTKMINLAHEGYTFVAATTTTLAREKVVALENGLDHRIVALYRYHEMLHYNQYAKKNDKPLCHNSYLCYSDDGKLSFIYEVYDETSKSGTCFCSDFDMEYYNEMKKNLESLFSDTEGFLFNDYSVINFLNWCKGDKKNIVVRKYAVIIDEKGEEYFASVALTDEFVENETVDIHFKDDVIEGKVVSVCEFSEIDAPFDLREANSIIVTKKGLKNE